MNKNYTLHNGNCLDVMKTMDDNSVDSIVTDPPYGLSFMGKKWDYDVPSQEIWEQALRVLKPGGYLLAFAGTRTQHRMAVRIEDAGFEIRDMIAWVYGSGFPKSHNISKSLDKMAGAEREVVGKRQHPTLKDKTKIDRQSSTQFHAGNTIKDEWDITAPSTDEAKKWEGWGTALKPALEPITIARKPLEEKTVAKNVLKYGTGGINIDESRIPTNPDVDDARLGGNGSCKTDKASANVGHGSIKGDNISSSEQGRFPANLIHDGSEEVMSGFPDTENKKGKPRTATIKNQTKLNNSKEVFANHEYEDNGSAARFFYCAKTSKKDRDEGLELFEAKAIADKKGNGIRRVCSTCGVSMMESHLCECDVKDWQPPKKLNNHPTVKPTDLMRYLVRMVTPKDGTILDPFMGSGSTGKGAMLEGFAFIGIELDPDYMEIAEARIKFADPNDEVFDEETTKSDENNKPIDNLFEF